MVEENDQIKSENENLKEELKKFKTPLFIKLVGNTGISYLGYTDSENSRQKNSEIIFVPETNRRAIKTTKPEPIIKPKVSGRSKIKWVWRPVEKIKPLSKPVTRTEIKKLNRLATTTIRR